MKTSATNRRVHQLLTAIASGRLNPRPDFQRRQVWTNDDKIAFIRTVISGLPFPEIYVCAGTLDPETGEATEFLVDGQQRITTLHQYFTAYADLRLGELMPYAELTRPEKEEFLEYEVVVRDLGKQPIEDIRKIFEVINSANYALNAIEIQNARYAGKFKQFCERIADSEFFKNWKTFTPSDIRRMQDLRFCLLLVSTVLSTYFNRDDGIEDFLKQYNDEFPLENDLEGQILETMQFVNSLEFDRHSRALRRTDLFTLLVETYRALFNRRVSLDGATAQHRLNEFYKKFGNYSFADTRLGMTYYIASLRSSTDRVNRYRRGEIIQSLLDPEYIPKLDFTALDEAFSNDPQQQSLDFTTDEP
ncbi:DUF262 domain-containing protein [Xanthomonas perforans]|uniref:GmrSD restriction endonuclease domain-containing protein n=1 Tax=Xanthomonas perforans TaxID=442694 RepID=UPI000F8C7112|nr:DUF262 domain-containing protein [Xanthomonas perforans]